MTRYLKKCKECGDYSLDNPESKCQKCGGDLINPKPTKFSPKDKYQEYRLKHFKKKFKERFDLET